jgi:hypothetical protein
MDLMAVVENLAFEVGRPNLFEKLMQVMAEVPYFPVVRKRESEERRGR